MSLESVRYLLRIYGIRPDDNKGQNFLTSEKILERILDAASVNSADRILEIGPGIGSLTALLAQRSSRVLAVEIDRQFQILLDRLTALNTNVDVVYDDILSMSFDRIKTSLSLDEHTSYKIVANIPYSITSRLMATMLRFALKPECIVLLIQKEVAERIVAGPGQHTKLSLSVQIYGDPETVFPVSRQHFYPIPAVDSAVLRIRNVRSWPYPEPEKRVWQLITFGFSSKRKKLLNNICAGAQLPREVIIRHFTEAHIGVNARAQELAVGDWLALARSLGNNPSIHSLI